MFAYKDMPEEQRNELIMKLKTILEGGCTATAMKIKNCPICNKELKHIEPKFIKDEA